MRCPSVQRWPLYARALGLLSLICCLLLPTAQAASKWIRLEADGFTILSDASPKEVEKFALDYAAFRQTTQELFAAPGQRAPRANLVLFQREKMLREHVPPSSDPNKTISVFTIEIDGDAVLALALAGDRQRALEMAFEFDTIWTLRRYGYFVPTWMGQGAGKVLSTLVLRKDHRILGRPADRFTGPLEREGLMNWERFFGIGVGSKEYSGHKTMHRFHSQAWALMHWVLMEEGDGGERFRRLAQELRRQGPVGAVETVMGIEDLTRTGGRVRRLSRTLQLPFDEAATRASWKITPATESEVQVRLADLLAFSGRAAQANWAIEQALADDPNSPLVQEAAARRELRQQRPDLAIDRYRAAIAAGSTNPTPYLRSATDRLNRGRRGQYDYLGGGVPREVNAALDEIRRAIELDPGSQEAYQLLGRAFYVSRELPPTAIDELSPGIGPGETGAMVRFYRGLAYLRLKNPKDARDDFLAVSEDNEASEALQLNAINQLQRAEFDVVRQDVERLLLAGDFAEARQRLRSAREPVQDAELLTQYQRLADWMEQNIIKLQQAGANRASASGSP